MSIKVKKNLAIILVVIFTLLFLWGRESDAAELRIGLGTGVANTASSARAQDLMITTTDRRWYFQITRIGSLPYAQSRLVAAPYGGFKRIVTEFDTLTRFSGGYRVNWRRDKKLSPYMRLGMSVFDREPQSLISDKWAFGMAVGVRFKDIFEIEMQHNSTAGRTERNRGLNFVTVGVVLPFGASK